VTHVSGIIEPYRTCERFPAYLGSIIIAKMYVNDEAVAR
jgi:hypothetical protein